MPLQIQTPPLMVREQSWVVLGAWNMLKLFGQGGGRKLYLGA